MHYRGRSIFSQRKKKRIFHHYNYYTYFVVSYCESSLKCWNVETFNNYKMIAFTAEFHAYLSDYNVADPTCGMRTDRAR